MRTRIMADLKEAMRNKDATRIGTLRLMLAALKDREIALRGDDGGEQLPEAEVMALLSKMIKQRDESIATYEQAGRMELAERERAEAAVIREFLPKPLSAEGVAKAIDAAIAETGAESIRDMGRVMAALKSRHAGRMDFAKAGAQVKAALG